jgi:hypothetical protein
MANSRYGANADDKRWIEILQQAIRIAPILRWRYPPGPIGWSDPLRTSTREIRLSCGGSWRRACAFGALYAFLSAPVLICGQINFRTITARSPNTRWRYGRSAACHP